MKISKLVTESCLIYGQADYAARIENYLKEIFPNMRLYVLAVPLFYEQPDRTEFDFSEYDSKLQNYPRYIPIYLCFSAKNISVPYRRLALMGFHDIRQYDSVLDNLLKKKFWEHYFLSKGEVFVDIYGWPDSRPESGQKVVVYQAKSDKDKELSNDMEFISEYIVPMQAGAILTEKRISKVIDSTGDNISERNRRYSEMTVFYWMWKNATADYLGLCHYRRLWVNLDAIAMKLRSTDVDVVLPLPTLCEHSVHEDYLLKHIPTVWQPMMEVLQGQSPEYYIAAQTIFQERVFYASNMCILKRNVLDDLCRWMFPIVMEIEKRVGDLDDPYYNRYAGFCTERLITLYFRYNKHHWKIAHAEKVFL